MQAVILVIDSFGIGALPDADSYGDTGSNTALHICQTIEGEKWPALKALGLGNAAELTDGDLPGCGHQKNPAAYYGVMAEVSPGKDTTTGHWELAGIELEKPFHLFPPEYPSFPEELVRAFERETGRGILGNKAASGTVIIQELGDQHVSSGSPIVYTSADSVFQIAAHEETIPLEELYRICIIARELVDPYNVARVIARPFIGKDGSYTRTKNRHDYSIQMPYPSVLDHLQQEGIRTVGVGKIGDIFLEQGLSESYHDKGNSACLKKTTQLLKEPLPGNRMIFVNLVDTDMIYGHRRDVQGYCDAVSEIDAALPEMMHLLANGDLLIVTADHGCDPTFRGTDHTREYVPLLAYNKGASGSSLGIRDRFSDVAQTLCAYFGVAPYRNGESFLP